MLDRFTGRARKVMALARKEAQRFDHAFLATEHILLGLIEEGSGVAANVLRNLGLDRERILAEVVKRVPPGPSSNKLLSHLPFTPVTKSALEHSAEEAKDLGHPYIGTEHLLLGLLDEKSCLALACLEAMGASAEKVRLEVLGLLIDSRAAPPPSRMGAQQTWESMDLVDRNDRLRARIGLTPGEQPCLSLFDQDGMERVALRLEADGSPVLELKDRDGKIVFKAP